MSNKLETLNETKFRALAVSEAQDVLGGLQAAAGTKPTLMGGTFVGDVFILDYTPDESAPAPAPSEPILA